MVADFVWCKSLAINNYIYCSTVFNHTCILSIYVCLLFDLFPHIVQSNFRLLCVAQNICTEEETRMDARYRHAFRFYANKLIAYFHQRMSYHSHMHFMYIIHGLLSVFNVQRTLKLVCMRVRVSRIEYSKRSGSVQN